MSISIKIQSSVVQSKTFFAFFLYLSTPNFSTAFEIPKMLHFTQACFKQHVLQESVMVVEKQET